MLQLHVSTSFKEILSPVMLVKPPLGAFLGLNSKGEKALITFPSFKYYMSLYVVIRDSRLPRVLITRKAKTERGGGEEC